MTMMAPRERAPDPFALRLTATCQFTVSRELETDLESTLL